METPIERNISRLETQTNVGEMEEGKVGGAFSALTRKAAANRQHNSFRVPFYSQLLLFCLASYQILSFAIMSHEDQAFLMGSDIEDDLVVEEDMEHMEHDQQPAPFQPAVNIHHVNEIDTEADRMLETPWQNLTPDQCEVISRLVEKADSSQMRRAELLNSIEDSLMELAAIRGRNNGIPQQRK